MTPADKCRYDACIIVPAGTKGEGEVGMYKIPEGKYAIYRTELEEATINEQIGKAWDDLMGGCSLITDINLMIVPALKYIVKPKKKGKLVSLLCIFVSRSSRYKFFIEFSIHENETVVQFVIHRPKRLCHKENEARDVISSVTRNL